VVLFVADASFRRRPSIRLGLTGSDAFIGGVEGGGGGGGGLLHTFAKTDCGVRI